ncbi:MAG TPA: iron ABC transporter permease [Terriglobales bacterium]|nr:iron ABC transporter permease [Terriglobales bacterium]
MKVRTKQIDGLSSSEPSPAVSRKMRRGLNVGFHLGFCSLLLVLLAAMILAATVGAAHIELKVTLWVLLNRTGITHVARTWPNSAETILLQIRLPRVVAASLVGGALALAGAMFQGVLRNPLADPYVIGTSGGAALGATLGLLLSAHFSVLGFGVVPTLSFAGALCAAATAYRLAKVGGRTSVVTLLLAGFALSVVLSYSMSFLLIVNDRLQLNLRVLYSWLLGGISVTNWTQVKVIAGLVLTAGTAGIAFARSLNAMSLGDEMAEHLGVPVERHRAALLALGSMLTSAAVVGGGLIGFVGLIIPHAVRLVFGPEHSRLLPLSALTGAIFLVLADLLSRILIPPNELPVGILTAFLGGPIFLYLLRGSRQEYRC